MKSWSIFLLLVFYAVLHLPFLMSDPDKQVDLHTRGAWTDEGLYAAQARNFLNYGEFGIEENTTFIRGPLFDVIRIPYFWLLGQSLWAARLFTILGVMLPFLFFARSRQYILFGLFLLIPGLLHFRLFHFSHYAMAEMLAVSAVFIGFLYYADYIKSGNRKYLMLASLLISIAWGLKIQFLYLMVLIPLVTLIWHLMSLVKNDNSVRNLLKETSYATIYAMAFFLVYILVWYLPNRRFYNQIMFEQTQSRFDDWEILYRTLDFNFSGIVTDPKNIILVAGLVIAIIFLVKSMEKQSFRFQNKLIIVFGAVWVVLELHKLGMNYLPQRYLLSLYAAVAFFSGSVLYQLFSWTKLFRILLTAFLIVAFSVNGFYIFQSYQQRTFEIKTLNHYVNNYNWDGKTIAGVWAPGISWGTKAKVVPVWKDYNDPEQFFGVQKPVLIVEEPNEGTSEKFFQDNGYDLQQMSDSIKAFKLWRYDVNLYWLKPESHTKP